jgi:DNA polymerase III epsilon subunit-like protein
MIGVKGQKGNRLVCPQNDYVVIDTETTGVNIYTSEIIELAALKVVNGEVVDTFQSLV